MPGRKLPVLTGVLTVAVALIAVRIEWLNAEAGGRPPSHEYRDGNPEEGLVTWRTSGITTPAAWLRVYTAGDGKTVEQLSPPERSRMASDIRRALADNALGDFVGTFGLAQYCLVPALAVVAIALGSSRRWWWGVVPLAVAIAAGGAMAYRGYYAVFLS